MAVALSVDAVVVGVLRRTDEAVVGDSSRNIVAEVRTEVVRSTAAEVHSTEGHSIVVEVRTEVERTEVVRIELVVVVGILIGICIVVAVVLFEFYIRRGILCRLVVQWLHKLRLRR